MAVVTITSRHFRYRVDALMAQVAVFLPDAVRLAYLVDPDYGVAQSIDYTAIGVSTLAVPRYSQLAFALDAPGLCCAMKPWAMLDAISRPDIDRVLYLDNDISLYQPPAEWLSLLDRHPIIVTPHFIRPLPEPARHLEVSTLASGTYNAGMIAVRSHNESFAFLHWWADRMSIPRHLYISTYDQPWLNHAPAFFPELTVMRNPGYNVAYWNLSERRLERHGESYEVNGEPLVAFHFSRLDESAPAAFTSLCCGADGTTESNVMQLVKERMRMVNANGRLATLARGYGFAQFDDGMEISFYHRSVIALKYWDQIPHDLNLFSKAELKRISHLQQDMLLQKRHLMTRVSNRLRNGMLGLRGL